MSFILRGAEIGSCAGLRSRPHSKAPMTQGRLSHRERLVDMPAGVWVAESDHIPGLVAEAESMNALVEKVRVLASELFELNGGGEPGQKVDCKFLSWHTANGALKQSGIPKQC